jgi:uncharacterized membrane protein
MIATRKVVFFGAVSLCGLALAPAWLSDGHRIFALAVFAFFSKVCHQLPERSLVLFGAPVAICVRCLGIYAGTALGSLTHLNRRSAFYWFGAALAVNFLDVAAESVGLHGNMPLLRLLIGGFLGITVGALLSVDVPITAISREPTERAVLKA